MDTSTNNNKTGLKIKFAVFYILSVVIILFIYSFAASDSSTNYTTTSASPLDENSLTSGSTISRLEFLNNSYRNLKALDVQFSRLNADSIGAEAFYNFDSISVQAEMRFTKSLDSLAKIAHALPNKQEALRLQNFVESYKMALEDRLAMQTFYKNAPEPTEPDNSQQMIQQLQYEIKARNKHIAELENQVYSLQKKVGQP